MDGKTAREMILDHIQNIRGKLYTFRAQLDRRGQKHDASKLEEPESRIFDEYSHKLRGMTYGSEEYEMCRREMAGALDHHYAENRHHPDHFKKWVCDLCFAEYLVDPNHQCLRCGNGSFAVEPDVSQMNLVDIVEMFCDWLAAVERHADGDIFKSIQHNEQRFKISPQLSSIFRNTARDVFLCGEEVADERKADS